MPKTCIYCGIEIQDKRENNPNGYIHNIQNESYCCEYCNLFAHINRSWYQLMITPNSTYPLISIENSITELKKDYTRIQKHYIKAMAIRSIKKSVIENLQAKEETKYPIITICSNEQHTQQITEHYKNLTKEGYIVLIHLIQDDKSSSDNLQIAKLDMADEIHFLTNINQQIEKTAPAEIEYIRKKGKYYRIIHTP